MRGRTGRLVHLGSAEKDSQFHLYRRVGDPVLDERDRAFRQTPRPSNGVAVDWNARADAYRVALTPVLRDELAAALCLPASVLGVLGVGWCAREECWTIPERDGLGHIVGVNRRYRDGNKKVIAGGHRGLYVPAAWRERGGPVLCPEGPSDTLALWRWGCARSAGPTTPAASRPSLNFCRTCRPIGRSWSSASSTPEEEGSWPGRDGAALTADLLESLLKGGWNGRCPPAARRMCAPRMCAPGR